MFLRIPPGIPSMISPAILSGIRLGYSKKTPFTITLGNIHNFFYELLQRNLPGFFMDASRLLSDIPLDIHFGIQSLGFHLEFKVFPAFSSLILHGFYVWDFAQDSFRKLSRNSLKKASMVIS